MSTKLHNYFLAYLVTAKIICGIRNKKPSKLKVRYKSEEFLGYLVLLQPYFWTILSKADLASPSVYSLSGFDASLARGSDIISALTWTRIPSMSLVDSQPERVSSSIQILPPTVT